MMQTNPSLLICLSLVAQWLELLPRLQKLLSLIPGLDENFSMLDSAPGDQLENSSNPLDIHKQGLQPPLSLSAEVDHHHLDHLLFTIHSVPECGFEGLK